MQAGASGGETRLPRCRLMRRIRITVSYDGTNYYGWQVQPGFATIQGILECVLSEIEGSEVAVHGSGRSHSPPARGHTADAAVLTAPAKRRR